MNAATALPFPSPLAKRARDVDADFDPVRFTTMSRAANAFCRAWFRFQLRGFERIPEGPCLFVANHSGVGLADVLCLLGELGTRFGLERRVVGLMHSFPVSIPVFGDVWRGVGAVAASPEAAKAAFSRGHDVLVYPGGDVDAFRGVHRPRDVVFGSRRGYVRLALEMNVPIVPVATIGTHWTYLVPPGGEAISRALGLKERARLETLPMTAGLLAAGAVAAVAPWAAPLALAAALVPNPARVTTELLAPIDVTTRTAGVKDPGERIEAAHRLVHGALQDAVSTMRHA